MTTRSELLAYLDSILLPKNISDYGPNGLQVEGRDEIAKIVTGVSACQALIDVAIAQKADAILVHHGFFWQNEDPRVIGIKQRRLKALLQHNINLIGYHLPLDVHPQYGNNIQLAKLLEIQVLKRKANDDTMLFIGHLKLPVSGELFSKRIAKTFNREPQYIPGQSKTIETIAWCTGGGADFIHQAIPHHVDAFLTGELYERTVSVARETGMHLFGAGHHATERYGIKALGEHLSDYFKIQVEFVDIDNPV